MDILLRCRLDKAMDKIKGGVGPFSLEPLEEIIRELDKAASDAEDKIEEAKSDASYAEERAREAQSERDDLESEKQALETKCEAWEGIVERAYGALDKALESGCRPTNTELREVLAILKETPK